MNRRLFLVFSLALAAGADAQSTESLKRTEHSIAVQLAAGGTSGFITSYGRQLGPMRAANISVQGRTEDAIAVRADLWAIHSSDRTDYYTFVSPNPEPVLTDHITEDAFAVAIGVSPVFRLNLPADISVEASVGGGFVPYARGTRRHERSANPAVDERSSNGGIGGYLSSGLTIRWWHFVVQQHVVQLLGVDVAVRNGENAPLTFGLRW